MAEPAEGVYAIVCVGSSKAIDVQGGDDVAGKNVWQYTRNSGDAQIWAFDKQSGGWQIRNSLTGKCLDIQGGTISAGQNVQQYSDNNSRAQRWDVATDGKTASFGGKSYSTYTIKSHGSNFSLAIKDNSSANKANVIVATFSSSNNFHRWILIPLSVFKNEGTYEIVLAADPKMCVDVAGGSTANNANIQVYTRNGSLSQVFRTAVSDETFACKLYNAKSGKVVDIKGTSFTKGSNIIQYSSASSRNDYQYWLPVKSGNCKINGQKVSTYMLRSSAGTNFCMDTKNDKSKAKTNLQLDEVGNTISQRFAFVKTEIYGSKMTVPGAISNALFQRDGSGKVTVKGLKFSSKYTMFQARYMVRRYKKNRTSYTATKWMSLKDNSSANEGWGSAWSYTFKATPKSGIVTIPKFSKTYTLNKSSQVAADLIIEIRAFTKDYNGGFIAHSGVKRTIVKVRQRPTVSLTSLSMVAQNDSVGVSISMKESLGEGCTRFTSRLIGSDGIPISSYATSTTTNAVHLLDKTLSRLPNQNEKITVEYTMLFRDGVTRSGRITSDKAFTPASSVPSFTPTVVPHDKDSCCVFITIPRHKSDCCTMIVSAAEGKRLVKCPVHSEDKSSGTITYVCAPPLNRNVGVTIYSRIGGKPYAKSITVRVNAHNFIWNWPSSARSEKLTNWASLIVNSDNPPQQTRTFNTDANFHNLSGRVYPVAFSSKALGISLNISGIVVDSGVKYQSAGPMPDHSSVAYIMQLVPLSGKGIHPLYRTPYGDWYHVGIISVDTSKNNLMYSDVSVQQQALED